MTDESKPGSPHRRWITSLAISALASVFLVFLLWVLVKAKASEFVDGVSSDTSSALKNLSPWEMGKRYSHEIDVAQGTAACMSLPLAESQHCFERVRAPTSIQGQAYLLVHALFLLIRSLFSEPPTQTLVDALQLFAGFLLEFVILGVLGRRLLTLGGYFFVLMGAIPLGILLTCLLSLPILGFMYFLSRVAGEVLPRTTVVVYGASWSGFVVLCSGRTVEDRLHHAIETVVERMVGRRL
ncbi:MAG: hypothetical protein WBF06_09375 [Candidatus Acidiferrales bacterium]